MAIKLLQPHTISVGYGVFHAEVGINVSNFTVKYFPEVNEDLPDFVGHTRYKVVSQFFSRTVECSGEISGTGGIMSFALGHAVSFLNNVNDFTPIYGTFFLDEITVTSARGSWKNVRVKATVHPTL